MNNAAGKQGRLRISVVTASFNAELDLPGLIDSLRAQTDRDFEWVVADGASTDATLGILQDIKDLNVVVSSQSDFGIYDAMNRGIRLSTGDFYIVAGADDRFEPDAIANFRAAMDAGDVDIVAARVNYMQRTMMVKAKPAWLLGHVAYIVAHSLGTAFRKDLHGQFGYYSRAFPIAADQLFVMRACEGGARRKVCDFVAGELGHGGVSSLDRTGNATEVFRVQLLLGRSRFIQTLLLLLRLLR